MEKNTQISTIQEEFIHKITKTLNGINSLSEKNKHYKKQDDYAQVYITTSSAFADIVEKFSKNMTEVEKTAGIDQFRNDLSKTNLDEKLLDTAANALYGKKPFNKIVIDKVFCPYINEIINYLIIDNKQDISKTIDEAILNNDQEFELSKKLSNELEGKTNFFARLFNRSKEKNSNVIESNKVNKEESIPLKQEGSRVNITVQEANEKFLKENYSTEMNKKQENKQKQKENEIKR